MSSGPFTRKGPLSSYSGRSFSNGGGGGGRRRRRMSQPISQYPPRLMGQTYIPAHYAPLNGQYSPSVAFFSDRDDVQTEPGDDFNFNSDSFRNDSIGYDIFGLQKVLKSTGSIKDDRDAQRCRKVTDVIRRCIRTDEMIEFHVGTVTNEYMTLCCYYADQYINVTETLTDLAPLRCVFWCESNFMNKDKKGQKNPFIYWKIYRCGISSCSHFKVEPKKGRNAQTFLPIEWKKIFNQTDRHIVNGIQRLLVEIYQKCVPFRARRDSFTFSCKRGQKGTKDIEIQKCEIGLNFKLLNDILLEWIEQVRNDAKTTMRKARILNDVSIYVHLGMNIVMLSFDRVAQSFKRKRGRSVTGHGNEQSSSSSSEMQPPRKKRKLNKGGHKNVSSKREGTSDGSNTKKKIKKKKKKKKGKKKKKKKKRLLLDDDDDNDITSPPVLSNRSDVIPDLDDEGMF